jgi:hypothetical protein
VRVIFSTGEPRSSFEEDELPSMEKRKEDNLKMEFINCKRLTYTKERLS